MKTADINDTYRTEGAEGVRRRLDEAKPYKPGDQNGGALGPRLVMRCAEDIEPKAVDWIWTGRLARGKHTAIAGEPGLGKSQVGIYILATITQGGSWADGEGAAPRGRVVILSAEDDAEDTIVPRLMAAGADLSMVEILHAVEQHDGSGHRTFSLQTDLHLLEALIKQLGEVQLVSIDPISAYFGKGVDSHKDTDVRTVLAPVSEMANRLGAAVLTVSHFNKGNSPTGTKALHKFMGSIAFVAAPRIAFAVIEDVEDTTRRLFLHAKNNLAPPPPGLAFRIQQTQLPNGSISASRIMWEAEPVDITADEAVAAGQTKETASALMEAKKLLVGLNGMSVKQIANETKAAGLSWATMRRAKDTLGFRSEREGEGWVWKR